MKILFYSFLIFLSMVGVMRSQQAPANSPFTLPPQSGDISPLNEKKKIVITGRALKDSDILVSEGDSVLAGELLIDRQAEKVSLEAQRAKVVESLELLNSAVILKPRPPEKVDFYYNLPKEDYSLQDLKISAIARRCGEFASALTAERNREPLRFGSAKIASLEKRLQRTREKMDKAIELKRNLELLKYETHYLRHQQSRIDAIAEEIGEVEQAIAIETDAEANRAGEFARRKLLEEAKLESAYLDCKERLKIAEGELVDSKYRRRLLEADRDRSFVVYEQERVKADRLYERDLINYEERVQEHRSKVFALETALEEIEYKIDNLAAIKSPYSGTIIRRRSRSSSGGYINVELVLLY